MRSLCLAFLLATPAFAGLVTNPTFDGNCASWSFAGFVNFCDASGNPGPSLVLNDFPGPVPQATQSIAGLILGTTYQITLSAKTYFNCCNSSSTPGAGVSIDGNQFDFLVVNSQPWTNYSFTFTYSGGSNLLTLSAQRNGTDSDAQFDNVDINQLSADVPEPASALILALGLLSLSIAKQLAPKPR
ncbi:MAG: hypothetical protein U0R19_24440 [Bryobacteraceae bacterium]